MFKVSKGNTKLGNITNINVSTKVCEGLKLPCFGNGCYACKGRYLFSNVKRRLEENLESYYNQHTEFTTNEISKQLPESGRVRWHSAGEIPDFGYFFMMVDLANKHQNLQFLAYTKRYALVNAYIGYGHQIPQNLTIVFSEWEGLEMENPYNMPVAQVAEFDNKWKGQRQFTCSGSCANCSKCWKLKAGDVIQFHKH